MTGAAACRLISDRLFLGRNTRFAELGRVLLPAARGVTGGLLVYRFIEIKGWDGFCPICVDIIVKNDDARIQMRYPGGKFRCYQKLINMMPPHRVYIETHLGGGAVLRHKAPAEHSIGIDCDAGVISAFVDHFDSRFKFFNRKAEDFLADYTFVGDELVYADPPYWPSARRSIRSPYRHDYNEEQHIYLLRMLRGLPCAVMVSGYGNSTYDELLCGWRKQVFSGTSHTGRRQETVWLNFEPSVLHDTRFLGETFRDRQTIKRKRARWLSRFRREPVGVQQAILSDLASAFVGGERRRWA